MKSRESYGAFAPERIRAFVRSRLWLALPTVAGVGFGCLWLYRRYVEGLPAGDAVLKGAFYALTLALCWAIGIWGATAPEVESDREEAPRGASRRALMFCVLLLVALVCLRPVLAWAAGELSPVQGGFSLLLRLLAVGAVLLPMWLHERLK